MVRKRSRTARKYYDDDENDSDSDFTLEDPPAEPEQKKYSLRQRKRRLFTEFEFDDDGDEIEPTKVPSDDDDFEVEKELEHDEAPGAEYIEKDSYADQYEPENEDIPEDADGLIDFEDMIRADIVVNKHRIDYDNLIQKTEIKVQPVVEQPVIKAKRGRKPKVRPEGEIDSSFLEPETEMKETEFEDKNDKDYNPDDDVDNDDVLIDCAKLMHAELSESPNETPSSIPTNEINNETNTGDNLIGEYETTKTPVEAVKVEGKADDILENANRVQNSIVKTDADNLSSVHQDAVDVNGKVPLPVCPNLVTTNEKLSQDLQTVIVDVDDDDVVLVEDEKKCEVIVLDD